MLASRRKTLILFSCLAILIGLTGCAGAADYDIDLPGEYSILRTSAHQVTIAPKTGTDAWGANAVPAEVTEVGWNDDYILAKQMKGEKNHAYWIIQLSNDHVTGPLSDSSFSEKKEEPGLSDITLKSVSDLPRE
ncbi:hypothetical protein NCCP2716_28370 [Sporosarcina sp. NCCP-2716]|uniref:DUF3997 domain-containing protein n=1 Tax=Sporosarcina sp. NCCP-2716 TaxID=2943679 RepID=UPI00203FC310|nr:DUF3997 domain-containing protein [Sporosarcina sp. NCCP-2716]GKV70339.1 hypothetical protein NCCP2716_28370 [Sporosarcina sp. NCCP-2716]